MDTVIEKVMNLPQLAPCPEVNQAFSELVAAVIKNPQWQPDDGALHRAVRCRCSEAEGRLECFWAQKIIQADDPLAAVEKFPYQSNYRELTAREVRLIEKSGLRLDMASKVAIIGSGPLPLTAWWLYKSMGAQVTHVDVCPVAIELARQFALALDWSCTCVLADGRSVDLANLAYDVIYVAGLAGETVEDKQQIIDNVLPSLRAGGRLLLRSARGSRGLLYPAFVARDMRGVRVLEEYHPADEVINSVFIYERSLG